MNELERVQQRLGTIERRITRLERLSGSIIGAGHGDIGGIRSWSNRRKERTANRQIDASVALVKLYPVCENLRATILRLQTQGPAQVPKPQPTRAELATCAFRAFDKYQPGSMLDVGGNAPLRIVKRNRLSLITEGGSKWTFEELTGFSGKEIQLSIL